jgi:hypothetical protein
MASDQYARYQMIPAEHIKAAENYAEYAASDRFEATDEWRLTQATLALAHTQIALAQMTGSQRA